MKILILGADPTGLGTANRLLELGHSNFEIVETNETIGGLTANFRDPCGFVWSQQKEALQSKYNYVNALIHSLKNVRLKKSKRRAWVYLEKNWVPYPLTKHLHYLPNSFANQCYEKWEKRKKSGHSPNNFREWIYSNYGSTLANRFLAPYYRKLWTHPLETISVNWLKSKIPSTVFDPNRPNTQLIPNRTFAYPDEGGFGKFLEKLAERFSDKIQLGRQLQALNLGKRELIVDGGERIKFNALINTKPLDQLVSISPEISRNSREKSKYLRRIGVHVTEIAVRGEPWGTKNRSYFPEKRFPFSRVSTVSRATYKNRHREENQHSLFCETNFSELKPCPSSDIVEHSINSLIECGLLHRSALKKIFRTSTIAIDYAYPVPSVGRDQVLKQIQSELREYCVFSRGRFGLWRYELGDLDHALMQGKELADHLITGGKESLLKDGYW